MNVTTTVKKVVTDQTYATVGATDLVVETFRGYTSQIAALRSELEPKKVQARVKAAPTDAQHYYADLTKRGEDLVARLRKQKATQDLIDQAEATVALGRGLVDTVRKAATDVERSAKTTLTVGRNEAAKASEAVADSVDVDTEKAKTAVADSAKRTTAAAKGTRTTAKKAANRTRTATKSTGDGAKKTAAKTAKAASTSAEKTGN